jgi:hypothetical protein
MVLPRSLSVYGEGKGEVGSILLLLQTGRRRLHKQARNLYQLAKNIIEIAMSLCSSP